jgi:hypothetical protein
MADPSPFEDFDVPADADAELDFSAPVKQATEDSAAHDAPAEDVFGQDEELEHHIEAHEVNTDHLQQHEDASAFGFTSEQHETADPFAAAAGDTHDEFSVENDPFAQQQKEQKEDEDNFMAGPTPLSIWEAERKVVLEERIRQAKLSKEKAITDAKEDITKFYKQREEALKKAQTANRTEEKSTKADLEQLMKNGTLWEKVARMANVQPKANQDAKQARMRKLLIQLKNDKVDENGVSKAKKK